MPACTCTMPAWKAAKNVFIKENWVVTARCCHHSAFNGYRETPSDYSTVWCLKCVSFWRTKARYVGILRDARPGQVEGALRSTSRAP